MEKLKDYCHSEYKNLSIAYQHWNYLRKTDFILPSSEPYDILVYSDNAI